jgi:hypothetical protein
MAMVIFMLTVTPSFWDQPRTWPLGCRPVIFSIDAVMKNQGTLQVPMAHASEVEQMLRANPHVLSIVRHPLPFPRERSTRKQQAA